MIKQPFSIFLSSSGHILKRKKEKGKHIAISIRKTSKFIDSIYLRFSKVIVFFSPSAVWYYYQYYNRNRSLDQYQGFNELLSLDPDIFLSIKWVFLKVLQVINGICKTSFCMDHCPDLLKLIPLVNKNSYTKWTCSHKYLTLSHIS